MFLKDQSKEEGNYQKSIQSSTTPDTHQALIYFVEGHLVDIHVKFAKIGAVV